MLVRVIDDDGQLVDESRDIQRLQAEHSIASAIEKTTADECDDWQNQAIRPDTFQDFPEQVQVIRGGVRVAAFPTLVPSDSGVLLQLVDNKDDSERLGSSGLVQLFCQKHARSLRGQVGNLPNVGQARIKLGHLIPGKQFDKAMEQLICRIALVDQQPMIRFKTEFEARNAAAVRQISIATQEVATWLPNFADQCHNVRKHRESAPQTWSEIFDDISEQLEWLFVEDFLATTPWQWLKEYPRYLQAICGRVEKLRSGGIPKDRKLREPIDRLNQTLDEAWDAATVDSAKIAQARWMTEELRVSIFAQQLGTKFSVSEKRIRNILDN
jgi:ATP-dependent helicase HrpA